MIHDDIAVIPSTLGDAFVIVLKMLVRTRKRVTSKHILPGTTSGGMIKLAQETHTNNPLGK